MERIARSALVLSVGLSLAGCYETGPLTTVKDDSGLSTPSPAPGDPADPLCPDSLDGMLEQVNQARAEARYCGEDWYAATTPLIRNSDLDRAAEVHSNNMANYDFFDHTGLDGSGVDDRVDEQGYAWRRVGENLAGGQATASQALSGLLDSPGHCRNLMSPDYTELGLACASNLDATYRIYWTQVFATPQ